MTYYQIISYPLFLIGGLEIFLGLLLLRNNPRNSPVNRSVAVFAFFSAAYALCTAIMYLRAHLGLPYDFFARANWIGWFTLSAGLQFIYFMKDEASRTARRIGYILYPYWFVIFCISISTELIELNNYALYPYVDQAGPLGKPVRLTGLMTIIWVMIAIYRLRKQVTGLKRAQLNYFAYGVLIFAAGGGIMAGLMPLISNSGFEPGLGSFFSLPWVLLTFYAITRYRLFDIRFFLSRAVTIVLLSVLFSAIQIGIFSLLEPVLGPIPALMISLPLIAAIFFGTPFSRVVQARIQDLIVRGKYDYQRVLKESTKAVVTLLHLEDILEHLSDAVRTSLGVKNTHLFLQMDNGLFVARRQPGDDRHPVFITFDDVLLHVACHAGRAVLREEVGMRTDDEQYLGLASFMSEHKAEIIIPMLCKGNLHGILMLGEKGNREPYMQSDIDLLETLAAHAAVAIENARLYDEARHAQESMQASEARFRSLVETTSDWVWEMDASALYTYVSPKVSDILGYAPEEVMGKTPFSLMPREDASKATETFASVSAHHEPFRNFVNTFLHKEGRLVAVETNGVPVIDQQGRLLGYRGIDRDVTERNKLEGQLRYAQKMEAIGKLAGGVAHDFNNILTAIVGYGNLLHMKMDKDDPLRPNVDQILAATERAANLTHSLLSFGKKRETARAAMDLNEVVRQTEKFLRGFLRDDILMRLRFFPDRLSVMGDAVQLERVIMNLVKNARDAMPHGGMLTVTTGPAELDAEFIKMHGYGRAGTFASLTVEDAGIGMDQGTIKKVFEPFFTTKGVGKGTGFGLSIVYGIVKEHEGYITVTSEPGQGTIFTVYLPLESQPAETVMPPAPTPVVDGYETVLVADDDEAARGFMATVLKGFGYTVLQAVDGADAVKKFKEANGGVQALILDVIMPTMSGREACDAIRKQRPDVRVLFTSGYSEDVIIQKKMLAEGQNFIMKPVSPKDLLQRLRAVLEQKPLPTSP